MEKKKRIDIIELVFMDETDKETESDDIIDDEYESFNDHFGNLSASADDSVFNSNIVDSVVEIDVRASRANAKGKKILSSKKVKKIISSKRRKKTVSPRKGKENQLIDFVSKMMGKIKRVQSAENKGLGPSP